MTAFPKQNTWIHLSFDLNSVTVRGTSEKVLYQPGLGFLSPECFCLNHQRFARKTTNISETLGVAAENYNFDYGKQMTQFGRICFLLFLKQLS